MTIEKSGLPSADAQAPKDLADSVKQALGGGESSKSAQATFDDYDWGYGPYEDRASRPPFTSTSKSSEGSRSGSYNSGGYSAPKSHYSYSYSSKPVGKVAVIGEDHSVISVHEVTSTNEDWWDLAKEVFEVRDETLLLPEQYANLEFSTPNFNACTFTATEDYLVARWGRKLHFTDKEWLAAHPFATDGGIPLEYTATCLAHMLEPYEMVPSRIRVRKGSLATGEQYATWMQALGINPFAMMDHSTTNEEFATKAGMPLAEVNKLFRFEFHDQPLPCSIVGERGWTNQQGVQTGSMGGHARYLAPRAKPGDWCISLQLAPKSEVDYLVAPALPVYKPRRGNARLALSDVRRPDGKKLVVLVSGRYVSPEEAEAKQGKGTIVTTVHSDGTKSVRVLNDWPAPPAPPAAPAKGLEDPRTPVGSGGTTMGTIEGLEVCLLCEEPWMPHDFEDGTNVCWSCWDMAWHGYRCPTCQTSFDKGFTPRFEMRDESVGYTVFSCPNKTCDAVLEIDEDDPKVAEKLSDLVALCKALPDTVGDSADHELDLLDAEFHRDLTEDLADAAAAEAALVADDVDPDFIVEH